MTHRLFSSLNWTLVALGCLSLSFVGCKNSAGTADGGYPGAAGSWGGVGGGSGGAGGTGGGGYESGYVGGNGADGGGYGSGAPFDNGSSGSDQALPSRREGAAFYGPGSENVNRGEFEAVLFDFDRFDIRPSEQGKIQAAAAAARQRGGSLLIAGFTDATGTEEYNRVLGERRALSVRSALISQGVPPGVIQTVSFGEDMPVGGDAANRRAEFGFVR